jgi:hypothetical protein
MYCCAASSFLAACRGWVVFRRRASWPAWKNLLRHRTPARPTAACLRLSQSSVAGGVTLATGAPQEPVLAASSSIDSTIETIASLIIGRRRMAPVIHLGVSIGASKSGAELAKRRARRPRVQRRRHRVGPERATTASVEAAGGSPDALITLGAMLGLLRRGAACFIARQDQMTPICGPATR